MRQTTLLSSIDWKCKSTWRRSAYNTMWCLIGCAMGDLGTILAFQLWAPETPTLVIMSLAIMNGLLTSIVLETILLSRSMVLMAALKTALGMSLVSMVAMEIAMNATDYVLVGKAALTWWSLGPSLLAGFLTPWPYNYWRLKRHGKGCCH